MNLVEFLEARIAEQEAGFQGRNYIGGLSIVTAVRDDVAVPPSLTAALLAECAQKRGILAVWKVVAEAASALAKLGIARAIPGRRLRHVHEPDIGSGQRRLLVHPIPETDRPGHCRAAELHPESRGTNR